MEGTHRNLAVDAANASVLDLSQAQWDAGFSLSPDGSQLLLTNGRGGYWLAPLLVAARPVGQPGGIVGVDNPDDGHRCRSIGAHQSHKPGNDPRPIVRFGLTVTALQSVHDHEDAGVR